MRHSLLVLIPCALALACAKTETPAADSTAATMAAPAMLAEADIAGTWTGTATMTGTDSVLMHWTQVCANGMCTRTSQEMANDTLHSTYRIDADSVTGVSSPYVDARTKARVIGNWVTRPSGSTITGHGWIVLADKPDSVVVRYTIAGARQ